MVGAIYQEVNKLRTSWFTSLSWAGGAGQQRDTQGVCSASSETERLAEKEGQLINVDSSAVEGNATFKIPLGLTKNAASLQKPPYIHLSLRQGQHSSGD